MVVQSQQDFPGAASWRTPLTLSGTAVTLETYCTVTVMLVVWVVLPLVPVTTMV